MELSSIFNTVAELPTALRIAAIYGSVLFFSLPTSLIYNLLLNPDRIKKGWRPDLFGFSVTPPDRTDVYINFFGKPHFAADKAGVHMHSLGMPFLPLLWTKRKISFNPLLRSHEDKLDNLVTQDGNIITLPLVTQFHVEKPLKFAFSAESLKAASLAINDRVKKHVQIKVGNMNTAEIFEMARAQSENGFNILDLDDRRMASDLAEFGVKVDSVFVFEPQLEEIQQDARAIRASQRDLSNIYKDTFEEIYTSTLQTMREAAEEELAENEDAEKSAETREQNLKDMKEKALAIAKDQAEEAKRNAQQIFFAQRLGGKGLVNIDKMNGMTDIGGQKTSRPKKFEPG